MSVPPPLDSDGQRVTDAEHLRLLAIFHFIGSGLAVVAGLALVAHFFVMHALFLHPMPMPARPPAPILAFLGLFYAMGALWLLASLLLNLLAGLCLLRRSNRMFCMVVGAINCLHVPFGTVLGVFTLVVLSRPSVRDLFAAQDLAGRNAPFSG